MKVYLLNSRKIPHVFVLLLTCGILFSFSSCSLSRKSFSPDIVHQYRLAEDDLRGLLFYTNNTLKLRREVSWNHRGLISGNRVFRRGGKTWEVITIRKGTPGILSICQGDSLVISFSGQKNILFLPDRMERYYTTASRPDNGRMLIGNQEFQTSGDLKLAIDYASYKKFEYPWYLSGR